ncbi:MAG TPA: hypothetical protein VMV82_00560 [Candidatus Dormibacteraeota bacterium]|nr:hypothetical protein [Candidatus Dormibacteraeota bacterium]
MTAIRAIVVLGISALLVAIVGPQLFVNPSTPYAGISLISNGVQSRLVIRVDRPSPAYRARLRTGDTISCLSVRDSARLFDPYSPNVEYTADPISLCARHDGAWRDVSFVPKPLPPPGLMYGTAGLAALRLAIYVLFLFVGCALVMARPSVMTWLLFGFCAANIPWAAPQGMLVWLAPALYAVVAILAQLLTWTGSGLLALFTLLVPDDRVPHGWRRTAFRVLAVATVLTGVFAVITTLWTSVSFTPIQNWIDEGFTALTVLLVVARLATMERQERARFGWAAFAIIIGVICNDVRTVVANNTISIAAAVLTVLMPLGLMYAILRRHVIDVRFVLSRTVVYGVITTVVVGIIGLVDWATSAYLSQVRVALAVDAAVTIGLGIALHRSYRWIEYGVDFLLFRKKHEAEAYLHRLARTLLRADREQTVDRALAHDPYEKLDLTMAALFRVQGTNYGVASAAGWDASDAIAFEREHDLVRFLATERTRLAIRDLRSHVTAEFVESGVLPAIAIPIFRGDDLFAFAVYGLHRDGTQLDPDELDVLERLCETAAQAYMRIENVRYHALLERPLPA